jgi:16S rRNA (cytosine967-C5)-methyltransferase
VRVGLYQVLFMDGVPPHAAVAETVAAVRPGGRGYVNALLRTVLRESHRVSEAEDRGGASPTKRLHRPGRSVTFFSRAVFPDPEADRIGWLAAVHSHPAFLVERWVARRGEPEAVERMERANRPPPLILRPRAGRTDAEDLGRRLAGEGVAAELLVRAEGADAVLVPPGGERLLNSRSFRQGLFSVQDDQQMDAAEILDPQPGEVVWDACAAPGGKACQLGELLEQREGSGGSGRVIATDVSDERLPMLTGNVERLRLRNVEVASFDLLGDQTPPGRPERGFDAILLDVPCSNTAVLGRRPEVRWRLREDTFERMAERQGQMLEAALAHLAPGGRLIYSVCSLEPEETEGHGLGATRSALVWRWPPASGDGA